MRKRYVRITRGCTMFESRDAIVEAIHSEPWKSQAEISAVFGKSSNWAGVILNRTDSKTFRDIRSDRIKQLVAEHEAKQELPND